MKKNLHLVLNMYMDCAMGMQMFCMPCFAIRKFPISG